MPPDKTAFSVNKEKAGNAKEFEKASKLKRKMLVFGENKSKAEDNVIDFNGRLDYNGKVLGFVKNKIEAYMKDMMKLKEKKQDLNRLNHSAKAEMKLKKKKSLRFGKNKTQANKDGRLQLAEQPV